MFVNFDLTIAASPGAPTRGLLSAVSPLGVVHGVPVELPEALVARDGADYLEGAESFRDAVRMGHRPTGGGREIGATLRDLAFRKVPEIGTLFGRTRGLAVAQQSSLVVRLLLDSRALATLPWELMLDPDGGTDRFLALAPSTHIVRVARVRTYAVVARPVPPPLEMLLILSSPMQRSDADPEPFDIYEEKRALLAELEPLQASGRLRVEVEDRPTLENLRSRMAEKAGGYHLIHYIGHAVSDGLVLEANDGGPMRVGAEDFTQLLATTCKDLRLVFFCGCETAQQPDDAAPEEWRKELSIADHCVREAAQAVIGMQANLRFPTERTFARYAYQSLAAGRSLLDAVAIARTAVAADRDIGKPALDWAVPCVFLGGEPGGPLMDVTSATTRPTPPRPRAQLRLDAVQLERTFFARHIALRQTIDFLAGTTRKRLLAITGGSSGERAQLVDRALEDAGDALDFVLELSIARLRSKDDPLDQLCALVRDVLRMRVADAPAKDGRSGAEQWDFLVEFLDTSRARIALVLTDIDDATPCEPLRAALKKLADRRLATRILLLGAKIEAVAALDDARLMSLSIGPLGWTDVKRWVGRNLPTLGRFTAEQLAAEFSRLGSLGTDLEVWDKLARDIIARPDAPLSDLVFEVLAARRPTPIATPEPTAPAPTPVATGIRIAIAGPHLVGREAEFAAAITKLAIEHGIPGAVTAAGDASHAPLATLLPLPTPFDNKFMATFGDVILWLRRAAEAGADIVLLDIGSKDQVDEIREIITHIDAFGSLVIAAGGNEKVPVYPAWYPETLAIGTRVGELSMWDAALGKPDLFAPMDAANSPLAEALAMPQIRGSSIAAIHVTMAAALVWAADDKLTGPDVRRILSESAKRAEGKPPELDLAAAINRALEGRALRSLAKSPMTPSELAGATGIDPSRLYAVTGSLIGKAITWTDNNTRWQVMNPSPMAGSLR